MKLGGKFRLKIVDSNDKPVQGCGFHRLNWRGRFEYFELDHIQIKSDKNGTWEWDEAPLDEFVGNIYYRGVREFITLADQTIAPNGTEQLLNFLPSSTFLERKIGTANGLKNKITLGPSRE